MSQPIKQIKGYGGKYSVTADGRILSRCGKKPKWLKPQLQRTGYMTVSLIKNTVSIHRLVAEAFVANPNNLSVVNHMDGNKKNNNETNLEWCTHQHNDEHARLNGLLNPPVGERNINAKLTWILVAELRKLHSFGRHTHRQLGELFGIDQAQATRIINNKAWRV